MSMKELVAGVFDIDTHEDTITQLQLEKESLARQVAKLSVENTSLKERNDFLELSEKDKLEVMGESLNGLKQQYENCIAQYNDMTDRARGVVIEAEQKLLDIKEKLNAAFANGRVSAYSEMGIRNIEAHERDNALVRLEDGSVVELILGLETVYDEKDVGDDEIFIDDLVEAV